MKRFSQKCQMKAAQYRIGRITLHVAVLVISHKHFAIHLQGILRDIRGI